MEHSLRSCARCGDALGPDTDRCELCGTPVTQEPRDDAMATGFLDTVQLGSLPGEPADERIVRPSLAILFRMAVGPAADYYAPRFLEYERTGRSFPSWNWAAPWVPTVWAFYHKLWVAGLAFALWPVAAMGVVRSRRSLPRRFDVRFVRLRAPAAVGDPRHRRGSRRQHAALSQGAAAGPRRRSRNRAARRGGASARRARADRVRVGGAPRRRRDHFVAARRCAVPPDRRCRPRRPDTRRRGPVRAAAAAAAGRRRLGSREIVADRAELRDHRPAIRLRFPRGRST